MALELSPYTWRIVIVITYSSSTAATTAYTNISNAIASFNGSASPKSERFNAGLAQPTTTQVSASYEAPTEDDAKALVNLLHNSISTTNRTNVLVSLYRGNIP